MAQPYVHIELDKPRKLRFRYSDLADIEQTYSIGLSGLLGGQAMHGTRILLSYGLRWQDDKMTPKSAGGLIDGWIEKGQDLQTLQEKIFEALELSGVLPKRVKAEDEDPNESSAAMTAA